MSHTQRNKGDKVMKEINKIYKIYENNNQLLFGGSTPESANIIISNPTEKLLEIVGELTTATVSTLVEFGDNVNNQMIKSIVMYILDRKMLTNANMQ
jgi:hypothetical protein